MSIAHFYRYMTRRNQGIMFSSELICDAMPTLLTPTEVVHSKNKEAINDSALYNRNKKLMHQNTTYITYFSLEKSSN